MIDRHQCVHQSRFEKSVVLVSCKEERPVATAIELAKFDWSAKGETRIVLLKRQTLNAERVVLPGVRIQRFIAEEIKAAPVKFIRTAAGAQIDATSGSSAIFSGELVANDLNFFNRFGRRREPLLGGSIVVVIQTVDGNVV